jgi:dihydrofolate synthase / folylpolyglutamate synthase
MNPRERLFDLEHFGIKLGLDNIRTLLHALNNPQRAWPAIHVAGTNGKGSVTAMVERGLRAAGHKTGRYTSPHLQDVEERVAVDGQPVSARLFDEATADVFTTIDRLRETGALAASPTFFEASTAVAFDIFRRSEISAGIIEVGLGGRFDATNVIEPLVTVITSIALDHERHLGNSLDQIAFEKAGIIKAGVPVIVGELPDAAMSVVAEQARVASAPLVVTGAIDVERVEMNNGRASLVIRTSKRRYPQVRLALNGVHQIENAVLALRTLETCADGGLAVDADHILTGLADVEWPARLEWLRTGTGGHVLIDAAHNPAGAAALAEYILAAEVAPIPTALAVMRDKDVDAIVTALAPVVSVVVATEVHSPRALPAAILAQRATALLPSSRVIACADPDAALDLALSEDGHACVAGSIFLVGPLRARLIARGAVPVDHPKRAVDAKR